MVLQKEKTSSEVFDAHLVRSAKVSVYERHKQDLALLKRMVRKYAPDKYNEVFRDESKPGYASYSKSGKQEDFCKYLRAIFKDIQSETEDNETVSEINAKLESNSLCPKQVTGDNRVIPYQIYWIELEKILDNASNYLPFLKQQDEDGYTPMQKLLSIMEFRVPYYVGPLNRESSFAWVERKAEGKVYPWNFEEKIDLEKSEQAFIDRMTNTCTYLPYADVLPKCSLLHEKFQVLNEINTIIVNRERIPVALKQRLYLDLFTQRKRITVKTIKNYLVRNGFYTESDRDQK